MHGFFERLVTMNLWLYYGGAISILSAVITAYDKLIAGGKRRRVPEQTLFLLALAGGAAAMYITMLLIRHKTKHKRFMLGLPLILCAQFALWFLIH